MSVRLRSAGVAILGAMAVAGCASTNAPYDRPLSAGPPPPPPLTSTRRAPPAAAYQPQPAQRPAVSAAKNSRRQYFDQRKGRYYYFDLKTHAYYWEDGTPRN